MNIKSRLSNYALWVSVFAFIPMLLKGLGMDILPSNYSELVSGFLGILVLLGIINNPTTESKGFTDDKAE